METSDFKVGDMVRFVNREATFPLGRIVSISEANGKIYCKTSKPMSHLGYDYPEWSEEHKDSFSLFNDKLKKTDVIFTYANEIELVLRQEI